MPFYYHSDAADADDLVEGASGKHREHAEGERGRVQPDADSDVDGGVFKLDGGGLVVREVGPRADEHDAGSQRRTEWQVIKH